jgi:hypothetical protein
VRLGLGDWQRCKAMLGNVVPTNKVLSVGKTRRTLRKCILGVEVHSGGCRLLYLALSEHMRAK